MYVVLRKDGLCLSEGLVSYCVCTIAYQNKWYKQSSEKQVLHTFVHKGRPEFKSSRWSSARQKDSFEMTREAVINIKLLSEFAANLPPIHIFTRAQTEATDPSNIACERIVSSVRNLTARHR